MLLQLPWSTARATCPASGPAKKEPRRRQYLCCARQLDCSELQALFRSSRLPESRHCYYAVGASMPGQYPRSPAQLTCPPSRPAKKEPQCQTTFGIAAPVVLLKAPIRSAAATVSSQAHYSSPHKEELGALDVERKHNLRASGVASSAVNFGSCPASCRCQRVVNSATPSVLRCPVNVHGAQHEQHVQHGACLCDCGEAAVRASSFGCVFVMWVRPPRQQPLSAASTHRCDRCERV
ncbi:uncharacterized protein LOC144100485 [Amblyomma americanum]